MNALRFWLRRVAWLLLLWACGFAAVAALAWVLRTVVRGVM